MSKVKPNPVIKFHFLSPLPLKDRTQLKSFIKEIAIKEGKALHSLDYIFCQDDYLLDINIRFLDHDDLTDIITFDLSEDKKETKGEIYISSDRVKENAINYKIPFAQELHRVMFHGILHLCGYKDKSPTEKKLMRQKEDYYLSLFEKAAR